MGFIITKSLGAPPGWATGAKGQGKGDAAHTNLYRFRHDNFGKEENEASVGRRSAWHGMSICGNTQLACVRTE